MENFNLFTEVKEPSFLNWLQLNDSLQTLEFEFLSFFFFFCQFLTGRLNYIPRQITSFLPPTTLQIGASFDDPSNPCVSYTCNSTGMVAVVQDCPKQTWCAEVSHGLNTGEQARHSSSTQPLLIFLLLWGSRPLAKRYRSVVSSMDLSTNSCIKSQRILEISAFIEYISHTKKGFYFFQLHKT